MKTTKCGQKYGATPRRVNKHLFCLTDSSEKDLKFVTGYMQVSQSEAVRMGLQLVARQVIATIERPPEKMTT